MKKVLFYTALIVAGMTACKKNENATSTLSGSKVITVAFDPMGTQKYTLFRFSDSVVVANSDSATGNWDFGLRFTNFIVNSYAGGPGAAGVIMQDGVFDNITTAPTTGYAYDTTTSKRAIKNGSWYDYNPVTHNFVPKAGKVFIFKTGDGNHYAKMELLSVEYGGLTGNPPSPTSLLYKFRYTYQPNGTPNF